MRVRLEDGDWLEVVVVANPESVLDDTAVDEVEDGRVGLELSNDIWPELNPLVIDELMPNRREADDTEDDRLANKLEVEEAVDVDEKVELEGGVEAELELLLVEEAREEAADDTFKFDLLGDAVLINETVVDVGVLKPPIVDDAELANPEDKDE